MTDVGVYVHVPYCSSRCGYCDFNTYAPGEDGHATRREWRSAALAEIDLAASRLGGDTEVSTVFFGGGTPTLLPAADLAAVLDRIREVFELAPDAEVTTEANPETITRRVLDDLLDAGFTRLSLGMQSADAGTLAVLDRRHSPGAAVTAARAAGLAGFDRVNLDLIYGTPGQTPQSWRDTLAAALETGVSHVSAYALKVESGTALHRRVARGEVPQPDDDAAAVAYEIADDVLSASGLPWYEISNWAVPGHECRHNRLYWTGADWWGIGPGAHSHVAGVRWWNFRNPSRWMSALAKGRDPREGSEELSGDERRTEAAMLAVRLVDGFDPLAIAADPTVAATLVADLTAEGLAEPTEVAGCLRLTRRGRLLADAVTLRLLEC